MMGSSAGFKDVDLSSPCQMWLMENQFRTIMCNLRQTSVHSEWLMVAAPNKYTVGMYQSNTEIHVSKDERHCSTFLYFAAL